MLNSQLRNKKKAIQQRHIEQRLLKSNHSISILQLIRQVRYSCDHDNKEDSSITTRSIIPKRLQLAQQVQPADELCLLVPKKINLSDKSVVLEHVRRAQSIQHIRNQCGLEIVSGSNTTRKVAIAPPNHKASLQNVYQRDMSIYMTDRQQLNPSVGKRSRASYDDRREEMQRQAIARKLILNQRLTSLSRWNNNKELDDEPAPPY